MSHLSQRQLCLLGYPSREETLALVGWMALSNMFGEGCADEVALTEKLPSQSASRWIGDISMVAGLRGRRSSDVRRHSQDVPKDRVRQVRARKRVGALA
jgi:hypothetical protein